MLVAVKVLNDDAAEGMEDFQQECAILERLRHPNIVKYFGTASNAAGHVSQPVLLSASVQPLIEVHRSLLIMCCHLHAVTASCNPW